ncbi:phage holin family protein [Paenibacillus larvae]|nr:phage holin family protein [Paenibacillus larvae]MDT2239022.1 phage holin family protein [Paenibacillus larvae]
MASGRSDSNKRRVAGRVQKIPRGGSEETKAGEPKGTPIRKRPRNRGDYSGAGGKYADAFTKESSTVASWLRLIKQEIVTAEDVPGISQSREVVLAYYRGGRTVERIDTALKTGVASVGGLTSFLFGGWPMLLQVLLVMVIVDYATGLMAAGTQEVSKARSA